MTAHETLSRCTANLLERGRDDATRTACPWLRRGGDAGHPGPNLKGLDPGNSILGGWNMVAAEVEEVADPVVGGQEALRLAGRLEPALTVVAWAGASSPPGCSGPCASYVRPRASPRGWPPGSSPACRCPALPLEQRATAFRPRSSATLFGSTFSSRSTAHGGRVAGRAKYYRQP